MTLTPLPAFQDNYLWFVHDGRRALVVDPGDAQPVMDSPQRPGLKLEGILVTDHHAPARMHQSLEKLASLPGETRACRTHEYTLSNLTSARAVEPGNLELIHYQQHFEELRARGHDAATAPDEVGEFATLRAWKNGFR